MTHSSVASLKERFRRAAREFAGTAPVAVASLSVRAVVGGPLDAVLTLGFTDLSAEALAKGEGDGLELPPLVIGDAAAQWFEANRRELVLDVRPEHVRSEFYRPFTRHGLRSVMVLPVFRDEELAGTVAAGSVERDAWTKRHLRMLQLLAAELTPEFPAPAPAEKGTVPMSGTVPKETSGTVPDIGTVPKETVGTVPHGGTVPEEAVGTVPDIGTVPLGGTVPTAHVEADALGRVREWDATAEGLFGIPRDEAVGKTLALFYRGSGGRLIEGRLAEELTARGRFTGRVLAWDVGGLPVTCEVDLIAIRTPAGARGFRGRFRRVDPDESGLAREGIRFDLARTYAFMNPVGPQRNSKL